MALFHRYAQLFLLSWFLIVESIPEHWVNIETTNDLSRYAHGTAQHLRMMEESTKNTKTKRPRRMVRRKKKKTQQAQEDDGGDLYSTTKDQQPLEKNENTSTNNNEKDEKKVKINFNYNPLSPRGPPQWDKVDVDGSAYFDYISPADDGDDLNECGKRQQSPVNLSPMKACNDDHQIRTLRGRPDFDTVRFEILPHTLRANLHIPEDHEQAARADFSNLSDWVYAKHVDIKIRSEHYLNGKQYKAEFQITHFWDDDDGKFIVLAILMDDSSDEHNIQLEEFIREWEELAWERKHKCQQQERQQQQQQQQQTIPTSIPKNQNKINTTMSYNNYTRSHPVRTKEDMIRIWGSDKGVPGQSNWDIYKFLTTSWYCGYHGSLTVPPCSQIVHWRILDYPMTMSKHQFARLRKLLFRQRDDNCRYSSVGWKGFANRPIQFNYHRVWCCTRDDWKPRDPWVNYTFSTEYQSFRKSVTSLSSSSHP